MKGLMRYFLKRSFGKKRLQPFYEALLRMSLRGMNYGNGGNYEESGELGVLQYINKKLGNEKSIIVFDVGANVGDYANAVYKSLDRRTIIHTFEPSKKTYESLRRNTSDIKNVILNNFGFGSAVGTLTLYTNRDGSGLASVYHRALGYAGISMDKTEEIHLSTIDNYCHENNIHRIHFLKLDIEGHELSALKGATKMLGNKEIDFIQFEFGGTNIDSHTFFRDFYQLLKTEYKIYRILKDGLAEIPRYNVTCEIFASINYLAERIG
jgi:FkbM family methyltransferase